MYDEIGKGVNPYGLDYPICLEDARHHQANAVSRVAISASSSSTLRQTPSLTSGRRLSIASAQIAQLLNHTAAALKSNDGPPFLPPQDKYHPCADEHLTTYLNRLDVVKAIHADPKMLPWNGCSDRVHYSQKDFQISTIGLYKEIIAQQDTTTPLKVLVFSGDDDSVCSLEGTQMWIWDLGVKAKSRKTWQPWLVHNQTAGFVTHFELKHTDSTFTFATVHGAGHEVPAYRPMEALELLKNYLNGKW
jgi:carboxypeptidase C (cathepsin A)